jgi:hypothetical protein
MDLPYETRTVAFIDILGVKEHVRRSIDDAAFRAKLHDALRIVERLARAWEIQPPGAAAGETPEKTDLRSQVFSDSIILSQRGSMAATIFIRVAQLTLALLDLRVLLRGGVAEGLLYHDDRVVFGPALVEAYELESTVAYYPRVVVSERVAAISCENQVTFHDRPNEKHLASAFLRTDADRCRHVDVLSTARASPPAVIGADDAELQRRIQRAVAAALEEEARASQRPSVRAKWGWLVQYLSELSGRAC